jgi:hypothetical protein
VKFNRLDGGQREQEEDGRESGNQILF